MEIAIYEADNILTPEMIQEVMCLCPFYNVDVAICLKLIANSIRLQMYRMYKIISNLTIVDSYGITRNQSDMCFK